MGSASEGRLWLLRSGLTWLGTSGASRSRRLWCKRDRRSRKIRRQAEISTQGIWHPDGLPKGGFLKGFNGRSFLPVQSAFTLKFTETSQSDPCRNCNFTITGGLIYVCYEVFAPFYSLPTPFLLPFKRPCLSQRQAFIGECPQEKQSNATPRWTRKERLRLTLGSQGPNPGIFRDKSLK